MQTAKFCIYCFWKPQKQFDSVKGVLRTEVGYIGGNKAWKKLLPFLVLIHGTK